MQLFYNEHISSVGQQLDLDAQESIHAAKVLRKTVGDFIAVSNGKGVLFEAEIISINKKKCSLLVVEKIETQETKPKLSIAIAPTKNIARIEWFIEKSVEIGIDKIELFYSSNSERRLVKKDRLQTKALSAMKQSLGYYLPIISEPLKFEVFLKLIDETYEVKYIAYCKENTNAFVQDLETSKKTLVMIGPEGGFTEQEIALALQYNFKSISLGKKRLRTETAALFTTSIFNALSE